MAVNPAGYVAPYDGGNPRTIGGTAIESISAGDLCFCSGAGDAVSSGLNSLEDGDVTIAAGASGAQFNGIAIQDASSGGQVAIATDVCAVIRANDTVTNGKTVLCDGEEAVADGTTAGHVIGRALSSATSGNYALVQLK